MAAPLYSDSIQGAPTSMTRKYGGRSKTEPGKLFFDIRENYGSAMCSFSTGTKHRIVPFEKRAGTEKAAAAPKSLVRQANGDHQMSDEIHQKAFIQKASDWFETFFNDLPG
ncbi:MAG: hypothetical protein R2861_12485 [Desulfobacterales bacterium]